MAGGFVITSATNTILLDEARIGEATFTATNKTGHPVRGRASAVALPPTAADWISVVGDAERDFPTDGAEQFVLRVVATDAPPGTFPVRLDVVSTSNPDDEWGQSAVVAFEIPEGPPEEPPPPPPDRPGYIETLVGSLVGLAVAVAVAMVFLVIGNLTNRGPVSAIGALILVFGSWIAPAIGTNVSLRRGGFVEPSRTALVQVIGVVFVGLPIFVGLIALEDNIGLDVGNALGLEDFLSLLLLLLDLVVMTVVSALLARAIVRWREKGHL